MTDKKTPCECNCVPAKLSTVQQADIDAITLAKDLYWANVDGSVQYEYFVWAKAMLKTHFISKRPVQDEWLRFVNDFSNGEAE